MPLNVRGAAPNCFLSFLFIFLAQRVFYIQISNCSNRTFRIFQLPLSVKSGHNCLYIKVCLFNTSLHMSPKSACGQEPRLNLWPHFNWVTDPPWQLAVLGPIPCFGLRERSAMNVSLLGACKCCNEYLLLSDFYIYTLYTCLQVFKLLVSIDVAIHRVRFARRIA